MSHWREGASVTDLVPLAGGSSSLTYLLSLGGVVAEEERLVLKVAPPGLAPVRNRDVLRQARLMHALADTPVRIPRSLFEDAGDPPAVPPYLAMNLVAGECVEPVLQPAAERQPESVVRARAYDAARALAELHCVDPASIDLAGSGPGADAELVMTIEDEIARWVRAFETVPADLQGEYVRCAAALRATVPPAMRPVLTHGDYRLGNTLCEGERVTAIIDWEIWALGDPRMDVTWLTFFTDEAAHPAAEPGESAGTPSKAELIAAYEKASGSPLADMEWFDALTKFKEAAATALLLKRGRKGGEMPPALQRMVAGVPRLLDEAMAALD
ncbi:phosphotransferase family protein [Nocardioides pacificus]